MTRGARSKFASAQRGRRAEQREQSGHDLIESLDQDRSSLLKGLVALREA